MDHVICIFKFNIQINSLNGKPAITTSVPSTTNQSPQQSPPAGNTFTSTQAAPHSTGKPNRAESEAHANDINNKTNLIKEEEDVGVILELPKIAGCTRNNAGAPSITQTIFGIEVQAIVYLFPVKICLRFYVKFESINFIFTNFLY